MDIKIEDKLIAKVITPEIKSIFLLGAADTGKTSLTEYLIHLLWNKFSLGIVDCDMGQSHIGPPTTIAWTRVRENFSSWQNLKTEDFYFVGTISPSGNVPRILEAVGSIFKKASRICEKIIIDTTGYVSGFEAVDFKTKKIKLIKPNLVIALYRKDELNPILKFLEQDNFTIFKIKVPKQLKHKSDTQRAFYRYSLFKNYFSKTKTFLFDKNILKRWDEPEDELINKVVALRNKKNKDLALGIIKKENPKTISVITPFKEFRKVSLIIVGRYKKAW